MNKKAALLLLMAASAAHSAQLETLDCLVMGDSIAVGIS